ncbi:hypothetical protein SpCBS45565_g04291 [Spizellomyces sp. 'palustris']|nr:hypothetical protein SpCBS45565_g04291 [Spizellomyces sp. 'palustris']
MIAIGGTIGTGLFVGSGATIALAGPVGALVAFFIVGTMVFFITSSLGEMATLIPVSGSFATYAGRFVDPGRSCIIELDAVSPMLYFHLNRVLSLLKNFLLISYLFCISLFIHSRLEL